MGPEFLDYHNLPLSNIVLLGRRDSNGDQDYCHPNVLFFPLVSGYSLSFLKFFFSILVFLAAGFGLAGDTHFNLIFGLFIYGNLQKGGKKKMLFQDFDDL